MLIAEPEETALYQVIRKNLFEFLEDGTITEEKNNEHDYGRGRGRSSQPWGRNETDTYVEAYD
jgi:hypothetical protein